MIGKLDQMCLDIKHVLKQLEKRFDKASVANSEQKRKVRRKTKQRYKAKKKRLAVARRKAEETDSSDIDDDGLDLLCTDDEI